MVKTLRIALILLVTLSLSSCFKKVTTNTLFVLKTLVQPASGEANIPAEEVELYGFFVDDEGWEVRSYEDALSHKITSETGEVIEDPDVFGEEFTKETLTQKYLAMPLTGSAFIVVVDKKTKMYAHCYMVLSAINLEETYVTLILHPWKTAPYTEGSATKGCYWSIYPPVVKQEDEQQKE